MNLAVIAGSLGILLSPPAVPIAAIPASPEEAIESAKREGGHRNVPAAEAVLREALQRWPGNAKLESYLGAVLFSTRRVDESYEYMVRVCAVGGHEPSCAVAVSIDLVRGRWKTAFERTAAFSETSCQASQRLWVLKQLEKNAAGALGAAKRLVQVEPERETSYLILAATRWRLGDRKGARQTLSEGRKSAEKVILLAEPVEWR